MAEKGPNPNFWQAPGRWPMSPVQPQPIYPVAKGGREAPKSSRHMNAHEKRAESQLHLINWEK
jgi:hypothetical protein